MKTSTKKPKITFSVLTFFDPFGDGKSTRKKRTLKYYQTENYTLSELQNKFDLLREANTSYYGEQIFSITNHGEKNNFPTHYLIK